jgi:hypothetical protein
MARGRGQLGICPLRARDASCYENAADLMRRAIGEPLMSFSATATRREYRVSIITD